MGDDNENRYIRSKGAFLAHLTIGRLKQAIFIQCLGKINAMNLRIVLILVATFFSKDNILCE
jgi:hypothetical protein